MSADDFDISLQANEVDFLYRQAEIRRDVKEAEKYVERWLRVVRDELQRMHDEGVDSHIAWLALGMASDRIEKAISPGIGISEVIP